MEGKSNNFNAISDNEIITYNSFMKRLFELHHDCNHEHYLAEVFIPFLRMCTIDNIKIVPTFDDRDCGPKAEKETKSKLHMKTICAKKENGGYVVPDYIYVPIEYSFDNPCKPYIMIETKKPALLKEGNYYQALSHSIQKYKSELFAEINECGGVIFTDGITWMFLVLKNGEIVESDEFAAIQLVDVYDSSYYNTNKISVKHNSKQTDLSNIDDIIEEPIEWERLKNNIITLLKRKSSK